jgi:hypothetical protein
MLRKVDSRLDDDKPRLEVLDEDELAEFVAAALLVALWPSCGAAINGLIP